jgi:prepilin-type N-terminal cleavage/methylation domain-containing protein/prepilin-type processing-associated H-X9-DG protein
MGAAASEEGNGDERGTMMSSLRLAEPARPRWRSGFTLVEMLVVISIIIILASIVVPVTMRVGGRSRVLACKNNLKQVHAALFSYAQTYNQHFPGQWRGDVLIGGLMTGTLKPFQATSPPADFDWDNVRGDDDLSPLFYGGYAADIRVFNCPSTTDRANPDRKDSGGDVLPRGYDIMWKATEARYTNASEYKLREGTGERGQLSYEYLGEIAPGIFRGDINAQLAWLAHDIDDRDLEDDKLDWEIDGDNHGTSGGNVLFIDGRVEWKLAEGWTAMIRAGHDERLAYVDPASDPMQPDIPAGADFGEWDKKLGWPSKPYAYDIMRLKTRVFSY